MSKSICSTGLRWLWVVVAVLIIDLGSKFLILQNFALGETVPLFPSLNLHYARNYGAAFSFLADSGGWQRWFFVGVAVIITLVLLVLLLKTPKSKPWTCLAISLIIGGAVGNLIDRVVLGHVVDFLLFYIKTDSGIWAYPAFNVADIGVCVGAALLVIISIFGKDEKEQ